MVKFVVQKRERCSAHLEISAGFRERRKKVAVRLGKLQRRELLLRFEKLLRSAIHIRVTLMGSRSPTS